RRNVLELPLAKVPHGPPGTRIDQCEYLLADVSVSPFRNRQIGYVCIERRVDPAVVKVVSGGLHCRLSCAALAQERCQRGDRVLLFLWLPFLLSEGGVGRFVLGRCGAKPRL